MLPPLISYSPLTITSQSGQKVNLARRDLFDARFQLLSEGDDVAPSRLEGHASKTSADALQFLEAPSDLIPGVYEGGLKTWECSLDLVGYLDGLEDDQKYVRGKRCLEVCSRILCA